MRRDDAISLLRYGDPLTEEYCEAVEIAIDALEAHEPVEVEERADTETINCPKCGQQLARVGYDKSIFLDTDETPNFCWVCGQAVKWDG